MRDSGESNEEAANRGRNCGSIESQNLDGQGVAAEEKTVLVKRDPLQVWMTERVRELAQLASFR